MKLFQCFYEIEGTISGKYNILCLESEPGARFDVQKNIGKVIDMAHKIAQDPKSNWFPLVKFNYDLILDSSFLMVRNMVKKYI